MLQRYDICSTDDGAGLDVEGWEGGNWCKHEDVEKLEASMAELLDELKMLVILRELGGGDASTSRELISRIEETP